MRIWKGQNCRNGEQIRYCPWLGGVMAPITKGHERIFWGDRNVLFLNCGSGYPTVYICQNLSNCRTE